MHDSVTVHMNASPAAVWDLVSDVTKIGRYSPETFEAEWTGDSTGPEVGATFRGHVKRNGKGPTYWSPCQVTACVPGQEFAFVVGPDRKAINTWRYVIEPTDDGGADVTESYTLAPTLPLKIYWALLGWSRGKTNRNGMQATLDRIKAEVESTTPS